MATNFNVSPYYDDFAESKNFHRVLFRPSFSVQGRELTQLQTILQNQIERFGSHVFQEGSVVIPGGISINTDYYSVQLASAFAGETVDPSQYYNEDSPVTIVGATSGVKAKVIGFKAATSDSGWREFSTFGWRDVRNPTPNAAVGDYTTSTQYAIPEFSTLLMPIASVALIVGNRIRTKKHTQH